LASLSRRDYSLDDWLRRFETLHPKKIDLTLDRVTAVIERLELKSPPYKIVTVGGTNGKGSCVAMLESIYWHAGYSVGAFTSPHLWRFNERIRVNGADTQDSELVELFSIIDSTLGGITLSYFESSTVAALLHFARKRVDVAVLEVGMGGRLDASNAVDTDCALVVSVDLDHREWLGDDREAIGRE
jgi:dihydrofolate synthase/folylpolyglutamate synthase